MSDLLWQLDRVSLPGRQRPRLEDLTLGVRAGVTAVLGPSGAGKSSLLNVLVGFESPAGGRARRLFAEDGDRLPLAWGPPDDGLWPHLTVEEHLAAVVPQRGLGPPGGQETSSAEAPEPSGAPTVESWLDRFDLIDRRGARPEQLSQGECARLAVARALAAEPRVLVLDEPLAHVDPAQVGRYWEVISQYRQARPDVSLVFSSHSPDVVLREAEHAICLWDGRAMYQGSVADLYHSPSTAELAWSLGPANWIAATDGEEWLREPPRRAGWYRPERLTVRSEPDSPVVVEQARPGVSVCVLDVRHERSGARRRFFHRPQAEPSQSGDRVALAIIV